MSSQGDELAKFQYEKKRLEIQEQLTLNKWLQSDDPDLLIKAQTYLQDVERRQASGVKTIIFDPEGINQGDGYLRKSANLSFSMLRSMSRTPIISSIIKTRVEQVSEFTNPQTDKFQPGFIIRKKKKSYFSKEEDTIVDKSLQKRIDDMVEFVMNCGESSNKWHGDTFDSLTRKIIPDSLSLDQANFEIVRNRKGLPVELIAADAATIRIADSFDDDEYHGVQKQQINGYYPSYVQVLDGVVKNEYFPWELCFGVRNPSTSIYSNGYGSSELEELMNIVTWMLNSDTYNGKFFSQGSAPKGIMKVSGNVNPTRLQEFRQNWQATTASVYNAHKVPVVESDNFEWIDLQRTNRDMEFSQWQEYLIKVSCAIYKIDPTEVFDLQHTNSGALRSDNKEENVKYSRDKGLKPLLRAYQAWLNKYVINPRDPELELVFVGLDVDSEEKELELDIKRVGSFMGYKEIRKKYGLEDLDPDDAILSPTYLQIQSMKMMGNPESNQAVDQFSDQGYQGDQGDQYAEKSVETNPFIQELNNYVKRNLMSNE